MSVTINENAPNHSMYLGAPCSAPNSIKSKSSTKLSEAIATTNKLNPIPMIPFEWMNPIPDPNILMTMLTKYSKQMPMVAETTISLKFSVGLTIPVL